MRPNANRSRWARRSLHALNAVLFLLLLGTGLLFQFPDWRGTLVGGYGMLLQDLHRWGGVAFAVVPALALAWVGSVLWRDAWKRASRPKGKNLRRGNLWAALAGGVGFTGTGAILWWSPQGMPLLVDASLWLHQVLTYIALAILVAHLIWIRRLILAKARAALGVGVPKLRERNAPAIIRETAGGETC